MPWKAMFDEDAVPKRKNRRSRRSAPRLHQTGPRLAPPRGHGDPDLIADVGRMLDKPHPAELLAFASSLLAVADRRADDVLSRFQGSPRNTVTLADLVGTLIEVRVREMTALLTVLAEMVDDELMVLRIRRERR